MQKGPKTQHRTAAAISHSILRMTRLLNVWKYFKVFPKVMVMKYPFYKRLVGGYFQKYTLAYFAFWQLILKTKRVEFIAVLFFFRLPTLLLRCAASLSRKLCWFLFHHWELERRLAGFAGGRLACLKGCSVRFLR